MKQLKLFSFAIVLLFLGLARAKAQQNVVSSGGDITSDNGSVSYSIGQLAYTGFSSENGSASEGMQHAIVVSVVAGVDKKDINLSLSTYPNPTTDLLTLYIENPEEQLSASLFDMSGIRLRAYLITEDKTTVDMRDLAESVYLLRVSGRKGHLKTFRIIKE